MPHCSFWRQGDYDRALDLYDRALCSVNSETYIDVSNQAALLKRLQLSGVDIGDRWKALAGHAQRASTITCCRFETRISVLHWRRTAISTLPAATSSRWPDFAYRDEGWRAEVTGNVLIPLCEGIIAYERGHYR